MISTGTKWSYYEQTRIRVGGSKVAVAAPIFSSDSNCNEGISGSYCGSGSDDGGG